MYLANKLFIILLLISALLLFGCTNKEPTISVGAIGSVEYGSGDCMPCPCSDPLCLGCPKKSYSTYNGNLYFLERNKLVTLGDSNFQLLVENSAKTIVVNGNYGINLNPGEYIVFPNSFNQYQGLYRYEDNLISILPDKVTQKDFSFFECTSY